VTNRNSVARLGRAALALWAVVRGNVRLLGAVARSGRELEWRPTIEQTYVLANRSILFITVIMGFTGAILVIQACVQAQRLVGDLSAIGPSYLQLLVREFGPTIVAMMVAARYGAGVAAELGAMAVTEQVDALRMAGAEPPGALVAPRVVAGIVGLVPLGVLGCLVAFVAGGVAASHFGVGFATYVSMRMVQGRDVVVGVAKCLAFGVAVPLVASHAGLAAHGGARGVGRATRHAVIGSSLAVLALDFAVGAVAYGIESVLP